VLCAYSDFVRQSSAVCGPACPTACFGRPDDDKQYDFTKQYCGGQVENPPNCHSLSGHCLAGWGATWSGTTASAFLRTCSTLQPVPLI
jgi:hypothetical protein